MSNTRSTQQHTFTWYLAMGVGYVFMIALRMLIGLAKGLVSMVRSAAKFHRAVAMERVERVEHAQVAPTVAAPAPAAPGSGKVTFKGHDFTDYEVAEIRCIQFPKVGFMSIWAYKKRGVVKRSITFTNPKVAKATGLAKLPLPDMAWPPGSSINAVEDACIRDAEQMIKAKCGVAATKAAPLKPAQSVVAKQDVSQPQPHPQSSEEVEGEGKQKPRSAPYIHMPPPKESHRGVLNGMGVFPRQQGLKKFKQYAVDLISPEVGPSRVWGEDLQRALEDSGAQVGDTIEVQLTGRSPRVHNGKDSHMNHYVVRVL